MSADVSDNPEVSAGPRVGVLGLGAMGEPMARRLLAGSGLQSVCVHNRTRGRTEALLAEGADWAGTPRVLAESCDVVLVMLGALEQLDPLLDGPDGLFADSAEELVVAIGSTASSQAVRDLATRARRTSDGRVTVVDAPVSGGVEGARAGTLSIMLGADDPRAVDLCRRALEPCGQVEHVGPLGAGQVAKACNQMVVSATAMALAEAVVLGQRAGIGPETLVGLLSRGYAGSRLLDAKMQKLIDRDYRPDGRAGYMARDLTLALAETQDNEVTAPLLTHLEESYRRLVAAGFGDDDLAVTRRFVEELQR